MATKKFGHKFIILVAVVGALGYCGTRPAKAETPVYFDFDFTVHSFLRGKEPLDGDVPFKARAGLKWQVNKDLFLKSGIEHRSNVDKSPPEYNNETVYAGFQWQPCLFNCK